MADLNLNPEPLNLVKSHFCVENGWSELKSGTLQKWRWTILKPAFGHLCVKFRPCSLGGRVGRSCRRFAFSYSFSTTRPRFARAKSKHHSRKHHHSDFESETLLRDIPPRSSTKCPSNEEYGQTFLQKSEIFRQNTNMLMNFCWFFRLERCGSVQLLRTFEQTLQGQCKTWKILRIKCNWKNRIRYVRKRGLRSTSIEKWQRTPNTKTFGKAK